MVGARERENQKNPSSKGYRQQAKNIIRRNVLTKDLSSTERAKVHAKGKEKGKAKRQTGARKGDGGRRKGNGEKGKGSGKGLEMKGMGHAARDGSSPPHVRVLAESLHKIA